MDGNWKKYFARAHRDRRVLEELVQRVYPKRMDTHTQQEVARREQILSFWKAHGDVATKDAFRVSRRTLYYWQRCSTPKSRVHRSGYVKRVIPSVVATEINRIRTDHPRLGKEKLAPLLKQYCEQKALPVWSEATVGRVLSQLKAEGKLVAPMKLRIDARTGKLHEKQLKLKKKLRRNGYLPLKPGALLQLDGVFKIIDGKRRYVFTAVDVVSRYAWSRAYPSASSRNGKDFLHHILATSPFPISHIQTDNGSEFLKEFRAAAIEAELVHFFNYAKSPKYQGWVERFNRSIQEECIDWHVSLLADNLPAFNERLASWMTWYNTHRIHRGLNRKTPAGIQKYSPLQYLAATA